jgi:hypothetical protein
MMTRLANCGRKPTSRWKPASVVTTVYPSDWKRWR